ESRGRVVDGRQQTDLEAGARRARPFALSIKRSSVRLMLRDPGLVTTFRADKGNGRRDFRRRRRTLFLVRDPKVARKTPQFSRKFFAERPPHLGAGLNLKTASFFSARQLRRLQDRLMFGELRLERFGLRI